MPLVQLILLIIGGALVALTFTIRELQHAGWYSVLITSLLAVGLYASTYGIDLKEAKKHIKVILGAITIGVLLKSVITGTILAFVFRDPFFFV